MKKVSKKYLYFYVRKDKYNLLTNIIDLSLSKFSKMNKDDVIDVYSKFKALIEDGDLDKSILIYKDIKNKLENSKNTTNTIN